MTDKYETPYMIATGALLLLSGAALLFSPVLSPVPLSAAEMPATPAPGAAVQTLDLGKLSALDARALDGKTVRVAFIVDCMSAHRHAVLVEAKGKPDVPGLLRCVSYAAASAPEVIVIGQRYVAEGVLRARLVPAWMIGGETFEQVLDVEVMDARPIEP